MAIPSAVEPRESEAVLSSPSAAISADDSSDSSTSSEESAPPASAVSFDVRWVYSPSGILRAQCGTLEGQEYFWDGLRLVRSGSLKGHSIGDFEWNGVFLSFVPRSPENGSLNRADSRIFLFDALEHTFHFLPAFMHENPEGASPGSTPQPSTSVSTIDTNLTWSQRGATFSKLNDPSLAWQISGSIPPPVMLAIAYLHHLKDNQLI